MNTSAFFPNQFTIDAQFADQENVQRMGSTDSEGAGARVLITIDALELHGITAVKQKIDDAVAKETEGDIRIENVGGHLWQRFARVGESPDQWFPGDRIDDDIGVTRLQERIPAASRANQRIAHHVNLLTRPDGAAEQTGVIRTQRQIEAEHDQIFREHLLESRVKPFRI